MGLAVSAGHVGLTHAANSLTPDPQRPGDAPTLPEPLPVPRSLPGWPWGSREPPARCEPARGLEVLQRRQRCGAGPCSSVPLLSLHEPRLPLDVAASPPSPGAQLAPGPAPAPALPQQRRGRDADPPQGIPPRGVLRHSTRVTLPVAGTAQRRQRRGSGGPRAPQGQPGPGSCGSPRRLPGDLLGQDLLLPDKPAGGTSSASRGAARQLLPPTNRKPQAAVLPRSHRRARTAAGRVAVPCPPRPARRGSPGGPGRDPRVVPVSHSPCSQSSVCRWAELGRNRSVQAGPGSVARRGVALHGTTPSWAVLLPPGTPVQLGGSQILLVPPQPPWPAVTGARGGATSTPANRSTLSQAVLAAARASLPEPARPKPLHPPRLPSRPPARDGLRWPVAAGFSHLLLAAQPAQTHMGGPHHATAPALDNGAGPSSCRCRA